MGGSTVINLAGKHQRGGAIFAVAESGAINIEIFSDTSQPERNEPLCLQGTGTQCNTTHFGVNIQIIFHLRHLPAFHPSPVPPPRGPCLHGGSRPHHQAGTNTTQAHTDPLLTCCFKAIVGSLQDGGKLKRFIGWCSNYHQSTASFFSLFSTLLEWILNVSAFLHARQPPPFKLCPEEVF